MNGGVFLHPKIDGECFSQEQIMFSKSDIQHLDKQYEELSHKLDQLHEFTRHGFNTMRQDHDDEYEKTAPILQKVLLLHCWR